MLAQTHDFLVNVFGEDNIEDGYFAIMTLPPAGGKPKHNWFNNPLEAAAFASDCDDLNTYFSMGLFPLNAGRRMENVTGMGCFGIDIDVKGDAHKRDNLCPSQEEAIELLANAIPGCAPTTIISSGNGIQGFFIFKEPLSFEDMDDRRAAYATASALHRTVALAAGKKGWHVDSTFDLSRVMRLPGTFNVKDPSNPKVVVVLEDSGQKYQGLEDLGEYLVADQEDWERVHKAFRASSPVWTRQMDIRLQPDACAPERKLEEILEAELRFAQLWFRKRKPGRPKVDSREEDHSMSVADMGLANKAVEYGWSNQEIADLIIEYRRKWQQKPGDFAKALREDYVERTIMKARDNYEEIKADKAKDEELKKIVDKIATAGKKGVNPGDDKNYQEDARQLIQKVLGIEVSRFIKYTGDNPEYYIESPRHGTIKIGTSKELTSQQLLRRALIDNANVVIGVIKARTFQNLLNAFMIIKEDVDAVEASSDLQILKQRVVDFWNSSIPSEDRNEGYERKEPFIDGKRAYIFGSPFRRWVSTEEGERISAKVMGMQLCQIGCRSEKMNFVTINGNGRRTANTTVYDITSLVGFQVDSDES